MLLVAEGVNAGELPLFIERERAPMLAVFALGDVVLFIGVMLPELLGVVMPALEALPLLGLLLRGTKSVGDTVDEDEPSGLLSSRALGTEVL